MTADLRHEEWCHHWDEGKACDCLRSEAMAVLTAERDQVRFDTAHTIAKSIERACTEDAPELVIDTYRNAARIARDGAA